MRIPIICRFAGKLSCWWKPNGVDL